MLTFFGHVAALTQSATGCSNNDSTTCSTGSTMGPMVSDRRTKENFRRIGTHPLGFGLYLFDYKAQWLERCGARRRFGVIADEVETVVPDAVSVGADGYKRVDYALLGIHPAR